MVSLFVLAGVALSFAVFLKQLQDNHVKVEGAFRQEAALLGGGFRDEVRSSLDDIASLADLVHAVGAVNRGEFREFVIPLLQRHPTVLPLVWAPRVPHTRRARSEAAARAGGQAGFRIFERDAQGHVIPAGRREEYCPVYYRVSLTEPDNAQLIGQDWSAMPACLEALA